MTPDHASTQEECFFSALLTPHRSLSPKGFVILMCALGAISFIAGSVFYAMGAWPVFGFFGADVAIVYFAFKLNYRAAKLYETVDLTEDALKVTRVLPSGRSQSWLFNPYWVRIGLKLRPGRTSELSLASHGEKLVFGSFLTDTERAEFAAALTDALSSARSPEPA